MLTSGDFKISPRVSRQISSPLTEIFELRDNYLSSANSFDLIDGSQGVPNYPPPIEVMNEIRNASQERESYSYTDRRGILTLRDAICDDFGSNYGFQVNTDEVLITSGCNAAFCVAASTILDQGDEVIVPSPHYFNHPMWLEMIGAKVVDSQSKANGEPDFDEIINLISPNTRAVVLVSPGNPTGATISAQTLEEVTLLLAQRGIYVILDETYRAFSEQAQLAFSGSQFDQNPNLIRLLSFSKELAIPGLRVGAACANRTLTHEMLKVHDCFSICTPLIGQLAAEAGLKHGNNWKLQRTSCIAKKRNRFSELISDQDRGFEIIQCGGFFAWLKHPFRDMSSWEVTRKLLFEAGLLTLPGCLFGKGQEAYVRVGVASLDEEEIKSFISRSSNLR
ncbi:aminotransferase class I/II-fold pyridoxal phosphate-dependent enzyme (plasmid) [Aliisedimentitalea scapharcae]|uniref:Aminotransferase n=1 Tax=Aliisedimentitalea scapharcae TaxID=1524259 RepID=A0ABZ2Y1S2_9RHOB